MAKCHAGMMEQETLCGETKRTLQTLLVRTASLLLWALLSTVLWHKITELQKVNDRSVSGMMSTVTASFKGIKDLVHSSMAKCHAGMMEQETLCGRRSALCRPFW
ncbi:hypothetical protein AAFF_G00417250 [Aldrovandia affinis]|uniref:Uncharacterized protein n=1 Tax=Aldrovandia affinis TaxID=143900 RepID=A0AAD7R3G6_9TELE|nr:hypothetical protein AAFF_G00417250 [Aldrovandia affinis]